MIEIFFNIEYFTIITKILSKSIIPCSINYGIYRIFTLVFNVKRKDESVHARDREIQDIDTEQLSRARVHVRELLLSQCSLLRMS